MARLLVVGDAALADELGRVGYEVRAAATAENALAQFDRSVPDLVVIEVVLPDASGTSLCAALRATSRAPVLFVSGQPSLAEKVRCFGIGGDDYLALPAAREELLLRVDALLRRVAWSSQLEPVTCIGDLEIDRAGRVVRRAGRPIRLSRQELDVLFALASTPGRPWPADKIARWLGIPVESRRATSELIRLKISRLRRKLEPEPRRPRYLHNQRDAGYMLALTSNAGM
jgi:two-component system KDP operon response regulator KdpE